MRLAKGQYVVLGIIFVILISSYMHCLDVSVKADEPPVEPITTVTDYHNGTICTVVDYQNGTQDFTIETTVDRSATLYENNNQSIPLMLENYQGQAAEAKGFVADSGSTTVTETHTEVINQQILMRWEYTVFKGRWNMTLGTWVAYVIIGVVVDIEFGIRLPVNITIEYETPVRFDQSNTTMYATITPIDLPNFNESLFIFESYFFVEFGGRLIPGGPYTWRYGPNYDLSQSFVTPLGDGIAFPIPPIPALSIAEFGIPLLGTFLEIDLGVQPGFGSKKITAIMNATGDAQAVQGTNIVWSYPNQSVPFIVRFGDYDPSVDWALVKLSDFRYYFTQFYVRFWLMFDFGSWIEWAFNDFNIHLTTIDMSWAIENLNWSIGSPQSIELWFRQPATVHDIAVTDVSPSIYKCYPGDVIDIAVIVENKGMSTEAFNASLYYDNHLITRTQTSQVLENKTSRTLQFEWNTTGVPLGNYTIKAEVSSVPDEMDVTNNEKTDGIVTLALYQLLATVVDGSSDPIPNAIVEIIGQQQASTDTNGEARFFLAKGSYHVRASKGTLNNSINVDLTSDTIVRIALVPPPALNATTTFEHDTLNLKSRGDWVTAYVELPEGYDVNNIDISTIKLNETIPAETEPVAVGDYDNDGIPDLAVRFNRTLLVGYLISKGIASGNVTLAITGLSVLVKMEHIQPVVTVAFEGSSSIKVSSLVGDVNCDGTVDVFDATLALQCYGSKEGSPDWNPNVNFAEEWDRINLYDVITLIYHYGQTSP